MAAQVPLVDYLVLGDHPHLEAHECTACDARFFDRRNACAACGGRDFRTVEVATQGEVRAFTIVSMRRPRHPRPVRRRRRRLRRHQRARQRGRRRARSRARAPGHEGRAHNVPDRRRQRRHRGRRLRVHSPGGQTAMADDVWILGINMTKFGKHPDKDTVDLAAEAALAALADGGVTMKDMGVLAAGNLMAASAGIGQQLQKQIGQTGIPVYNVANACATGATALRTAIMTVKAGEADMGLAVGVEKLAGAGLLGGGSRSEDSDTWEPKGRYGAVAPLDGRVGTDDDARRVRPGGHGVRAPLRRHQLRAVRPHLREEPRPLDPQPAGRLHEADEPRADHGRPHDRLPQHPADVLGQLRRRRRRGGGVGRQAQDPVGRAAAPGDQGGGLGADHRPVAGGLPGPARRQHAHPQCRHPGLRAGRRRAGGPRPGRAARLLRHGRAGRTTTTSPCASRAARSTSSRAAPRGATAACRSTCRAGSSPRATRSPPPASPTSGRCATTSGARPATARSRAPGSAWPTSSASARPAGSTSWRRPPPSSLR